MRGRYVGDTGAYASNPFTGLVDPMCAAVMLPGVYRLEAAAWEVDCAYTNKCPTAAYRGVGWSSGQAAREALVDDAARALGIDPMALRLMNTIPDEPQTSPTGCEYDGGSYAEAQRRAMQTIGYEEFRTRQVAARAEGRCVGIGFSPFVEPNGWASAMAKRMGFPFDYLDAASITIEPDGSVLVTLGLHSHGQGHQTTMAQIVADKLGVPFDTVKIVEGDTDRTAYGTGSYGSRSAVVGYGSISRAAEEVVDKVKRMAAYQLEASPDDIDIVGGTAFVRGAPDRSISMLMLGYTAYFGAFVGGKRPPDMDPYLDVDPLVRSAGDLLERLRRGDGRGRSGDGRRAGRSDRLRRRLRHHAEPDDRRGAADRSGGTGPRGGAVRVAAVRRGRQLPRGDAPRLPLPVHAGGADDRDRAHRDAVGGDRGRRQGRRRGWQRRRPRRDRQRRGRRARAARRVRRLDAARPRAPSARSSGRRAARPDLHRDRSRATPGRRSDRW